MGGTTEVSQHYGRGGLLDRLRAALIDDGADPDRPTIAALAPYDQFHGRGLEATEELAGHLEVAATDHLVDVGCGIGGPARYFADRFGCRITGIDLTDEFCAAARHLSHAMGLADRLTFEQGDALAMPFADSAFDGAYSMNVSMNIADKEGLYREIHRVLRPGGRLVISDIILDGGLPQAVVDDLLSYVGCVSGAMLRSDYLDTIAAAGLGDVRMLKDTDFLETLDLDSRGKLGELARAGGAAERELVGKVRSVTFRARRA